MITRFVCLLEHLPTDPKEEQRKEVLKLKRRFLRDRKITSAFFAKTGYRKKLVREVCG